MRRPLALLVAGSLLSACGFNHTNQDRSTRPTRATGTAARVMMPGESSPSLEQAEQPGSDDEQITMLGGDHHETDASQQDRDVPLGPLAVLFGYPFWVFGKSVSQNADKAAQERSDEKAAEKTARQNGEPATPGSGRDQAERARLAAENEKLRQQLGQRSAPAPAAAPTQAASPAGTAPSSSVREELAALERSLGKTVPAGSGAPTATLVQADGKGFASAEGDGTRESLDQNGDGKVDRVNHYSAGHVLTVVEEDTNHDGSLDTVSQYQDGKVSRKHSDTNGDGQPDSWSFYKAGDLVRHEVDQNGDGFRDLVSIYENGELVREEQDRNADGQPDLVTHYKDGEVSERHEDVDFDGKLDMASYYEKGRLVRRELSSPDVLEQWAPQSGS